MKKLIAFVLSFTMLISMALPVFATEDAVMSESTKENSVTNEQNEESTRLKPYVLYDASTDKGDGVVNIKGKKAFKWGPGEDELLNNALPPIEITPEMQMDKYQYVVIEMYSVKATNNIFSLRICGEDNPETDGEDEYYGKFINSWEGEWKEIRFLTTGGPRNIGDFYTTRSPLFPVGKGNLMYLMTNLHGSDPFYPETEVYVSKIYLDGELEQESREDSPTGEIIYIDRFDPENMTDYVSMVKEKHPNKHHPRLLVTDEIIERIKKYKDTDPTMKKIYQAIKKQADKFLTEPPPPPKSTYGPKNRISLDRRHLEDVAEYCGMMYLLTGEAKYPERVWKDVLNMANVDVIWSTLSTPFDSAHNANGVALAYDWCYDYWTDEQLLFMRNTVMKNALGDGIKIRNGNGYLGSRNNTSSATNKGYMTACLAICDEPGYEDFCNEYINSVIKYLPMNFLYQYYPDGAYSEGPSYWWYATESFLYSTWAMKTAIGTDGGLEDYPGMAKTSDMLFALNGPTGAFNFSDSSRTTMSAGAPVYLYLAERYNIPQLRTYYLDSVTQDDELEIADLIWYNPEVPTQINWRDGLPHEFFKNGIEPIVSLRSGYEKDSFFVATKGGNSATPHSQFESGTFVFDALGVRWVEEPGADTYDYDTPKYYLYRVRPEGNNCLFVDPTRAWEEGAGQTPAENPYDTICQMVSSGASEGSAYGVLDLSKSYQETLSEYKRGIALINNRTQMIVRDEIVTKEPYELYSYFHTQRANKITVNPDKKSLTMSNGNGTVCKVNFFSDIPNFEIGVMDAFQHPNSPRPGPDNYPQSDTSGLHKIYFHADNVKKGHITAVFTPLSDDREFDLPEILPTKDWDKYLNNASVTGISIDGIPLNNFDSGIGSYIFKADKVGTVTATADKNTEISITQANEMGETALITAKNKKTNKTSTYSVTFKNFSTPGLKEGLPIQSVEATSIIEPKNPPEHLIDNNLATRFVADSDDGSQGFTIDLGTSSKIVGVSMSFYRGASRKNKFTLEVSEDKVNWVKVFDGFASGTTAELEMFETISARGRYIRYSGYGCYANDETTQTTTLNSVTGIVPFGEVGEFSDTVGHWANEEIHFSRIHNLVNGVGENLYLPENSVTRAEFISMIVRACGFSQIPYEEGIFKDVSSNDWFSQNIMIAKDNGIIPEEMVKDGMLYPNDKLTREEMCAIAVLAYSSSAKRTVKNVNMTDIFKDLSDGPYLSYIDKAIGLRIVNGMTDTTFAPSENITRAQAATILKRVYLNIFNVNN